MRHTHARRTGMVVLTTLALCGSRRPAHASPPALVDLGTLGGDYTIALGLDEAGQVIGISAPAGTSPAQAFLYSNGVMTGLGTLGGSSSYPTTFNEHGQVAGYSDLTGDTSVGAFLWSGGAMIHLTLGGSTSYAWAINANGDVVGESSIPGDAATHAFLYSAGVMKDLGTLAGDTSSSAVAINANGVIVGHSGDGTTSHAFRYAGAVMTPLGTLGGSNSDAIGINAGGAIVGRSQRAGDVGWFGFVYSGNAMTDLGDLGGSDVTPYAINDAGYVIGTATIGASNNAFRWSLASNGPITDLGNFGGTQSHPTAVNANGVVVGVAYTPFDTTYRAFRYANGALDDLKTLGGSWSYAFAINDAGTIVGHSELADGSTHAFVVEAGVMNDLGTAGRAFSMAQWINSSGVIAGNLDANVEQARAFVTATADTTAPSISCPANMTIEATGPNGAIVGYPPPTVVDVEDPNPTVACVPASGTTFPLGSTTVTFTATDAAGNSAACGFTVQVVDTTAPSITAPVNFTVNATSPAGAIVSFAPTVADAVTALPAVSCSPASGSTFPIGTTTVLCSATDAAGNSSTSAFFVTVRRMLTALTPAKLWVGLVNLFPGAMTFDLRVEVLKNGSIIGNGQMNAISGVSSGGPTLRTIGLTLAGPTPIAAGDVLALRALVRISPGTLAAGLGVLAWNSNPYPNRFGSTIAGTPATYYLVGGPAAAGRVLQLAPPSGPTRLDLEMPTSGGGNAWKSFGTWQITLP